MGYPMKVVKVNMSLENKDYPIFSYVSQIKDKRRNIDWLWKPYIPKGKITLLTGDPGEGKTLIAMDIASRLTRGEPILGDESVEEPVTVVYQSAEDDLYDTLIPRLNAAGADLDRIVFIKDEESTLTLEDERISYTIRKTHAGLLVIDPLQAYLPDGGMLQSAGRMRDILGRVAGLAARENCAVLIIGHLTKRSTDRDLYRSLGSIDIAALARSVLKLERDPRDENNRILVQIKNSLAKCAKPIRCHILEGPVIEWIGYYEEEEKTFSGVSQNDKRSRCMDLLNEILQEGPASSSEIYRLMSVLDISPRTANQAKSDAGIRSRKRNRTWEWYLPEE